MLESSRWLRPVLWSVGVALAIWAATTPLLRNAENHLRTEFCLALSASVAAITLGTAVGTQWIRAAAWLALGILGQSAALQWIDAGPLIHYQHYRPAAYLIQRLDIAAILAFQAILVAFGIFNQRKAIRTWVSLHFGWRLYTALAVIFLPSATVSRDVNFYVIEILFASFVQAVNLGNLLLILSAIPSGTTAATGSVFARWFGSATSAYKPAADRFAISAAIWVTCVTALLSVAVYERHPHVPDEVSYLYHARYFAQGMLAMTAPPVPAAFDVDLLEFDRGRWFSPVPPGWPAMLAVGSWLGVPWLVNPVLAGFNILLAYILVQYFESRRTAQWVVLLLCISPWYLFMGMNFMTHTFTLTCALTACWGIAKAKQNGSLGWALLAGTATGIGSLIRPLDGLIAALIIGAWALCGRRLEFRSLAVWAMSTGAVGALVFPYNRFLTGDPVKAPIMAYADRHYGPGVNGLGFGPERGWGWQLDPYPGHSLLESLINDNLNLFSVNIELFGWATGSLFLVAAALFLGRERRRVDYAMLAAVGVVIAGYTFYWYSGGPDFGARYWYLMLIPLLVLSARGIHALEERLGARCLVGIVCLCFMALVNYLPWRAVDKYHGYLRMHPDVPDLAARHQFGRSLVLIRGARHPDFASAVIYNPLDLRANVPIYVWDANPEIRSQALDAFRDRPVWVLDGPSLTGGGFRVVSGPVQAAALLRTSRAH